MPATSTLADILILLAETDGLGTYIAAGTGATTTITETDTGVSELRGPFTGLNIGVGRPVTVIAGGTVGEDTYVSNWVPSTGVVTLSPAITTAATGFIIWEKDIEHGKYVEKAVSRALQNRIGRWELRPLTFVPDGDLQGASVADYWTKSTVGDTLAYVSAQIYPAGSAADEAGATGLNRVLQLTSTAAGNVEGNGIRVVEGNTLRAWRFQTAIRLVSGTGTATFSWRDSTNNAEIAVQLERGTDQHTMAVTEFGDFTVLAGTFMLPNNCAEIAPRLTLSATTMVAQMTPLIAFPTGTQHFPLPNRIEADELIGNFYHSTTRYGPGGLADIALSDPITNGDTLHWFYDYGDHRTVGLNFPIHRPVWFEEYVNGAAVTAMTDTTTFPADRVHKWARAELLDWLDKRDTVRGARAENGTLLPSKWRARRNRAFKTAQWSGYEPQLKQVLGRR